MTIHHIERPAPATRPAPRRRRSAASAAFVVALLSFTLAACAPDDGPGVASAGGGTGETGQATDEKKYEDMTDAERAELDRKFASCMRDNGVDMPDPDSGAAAAITLGGDDAEEVDAAFQACKEFMPNGGEPVKPSPEDLEAQRAFAKCMREHGVDMPDPDPDGGMTAAGQVPDDIQAFEAALEACNEAGGSGEFGLHVAPGGDE